MTEAPSKTVDLVIADKSPLVRAGLSALFKGDERFSLIEVLSDGRDFLDAVARSPFDIGIIGWDMPTVHGRNILRTLRERENAPKIVVYTGNAAPDVPRQVIQLGGAGFCPKGEPPERILETVILVSKGRMVFPFIDLSHRETDPFDTLTARERELLAGLAEGLTNKEIAGGLDISLNTVKFHLKNLYGKLSVNNRAQAVAWFLKHTEGR